MMKKTLITASVLLLASTIGFAAPDTTVPSKTGEQIDRPAPPNFQRPPKGPDFQKRNAEFEKRLNLTDKQKQKAEEIRKQNFEKMKPVMEKLKEKHQAEVALKNSTDEADKAKLEQLRKETGALMREMHEIKMQNMKDFEGILTKKQQKELTKIKEEGRKKFEQEHGKRPPFEILPQPKSVK